MKFKSFLSDLKKVSSLYGMLFLIESILVVSLCLVLFLVSNINLLVFLLVIAFLVLQVYIYYMFQKKLIKKVYNPEFDKNKNILIMIAIGFIIFIIYMFLLIGMLSTIFLDPLKIYGLIKYLDNFTFISYITGYGLMIAYTYLLFEVKNPLKNILVVFSFVLVGFLVSLVTKGFLIILIMLLGLILGSLGSIGIIILLFLLLILVVIAVSINKTIFICFAKYYKDDNKVENKIKEIYKDIKVFFKNLIK